MRKTVLTIVILLMMLGLAGCRKETAVKSVYLAGPFFDDTEIQNIEYAEKVLSEKGLSYFSPLRYTGKNEYGTSEWAYEIFETDKAEIEKADVVVALNYGNYSDSGTAWECGYAAGIGKPVILVHTDRNGNSNLMMHCGATTNIYLDDLAGYDFNTMPVYDYTGKMF